MTILTSVFRRVSYVMMCIKNNINPFECFKRVFYCPEVLE